MANALISTAELAARLAEPDLVVVDVRHDLAQPDWGEAAHRTSHIPGALFAHLDRDLSSEPSGRNGRHPLPSKEACEALFSRLGIEAGRTVVAYDQGSGMVAARLWWMLRWLGHDSATVLDGGFAKWVGEGRPVDARIAVPRQAAFAARDVGPIVPVEDVEASLDERSLTLVDARAPERYRGEVEPLDPVAGHIPGALNRYYTDNLKPDGTFKPADVLRGEFAQVLGTTPLEEIVHYCGSGVTACHNVLAMEVAGLPGTRVYPGSWSEWSSDSARPIALGDEPGAPLAESTSPDDVDSPGKSA